MGSGARTGAVTLIQRFGSTLNLNPPSSPTLFIHPSHASSPPLMSWMQRLKRVFHIDIERCDVYGATLRVIACIETPEFIERILISPRARQTESTTLALRHPVRPQRNTGLPITGPLADRTPKQQCHSTGCSTYPCTCGTGHPSRASAQGRRPLLPAISSKSRRWLVRHGRGHLLPP